MKYVQQYGYLWKISDAQYKKLENLLLAGEEYDLNKFGTCVGEVINALQIAERKQ